MKKPKFKKRYVLGQGYPCIFSDGGVYLLKRNDFMNPDFNTDYINVRTYSAGGFTGYVKSRSGKVKNLKELHLKTCPQYRLVLERVK